VFFLFGSAGAMSGWLLVLGRCSEVRRTGKSACATEKLRTLARLCWGVALAQAGMPVLLKPVATILFCGLIFFRVADHLLLEGVL